MNVFNNYCVRVLRQLIFGGKPWERTIYGIRIAGLWRTNVRLLLGFDVGARRRLHGEWKPLLYRETKRC